MCTWQMHEISEVINEILFQADHDFLVTIQFSTCKSASE